VRPPGSSPQACWAVWLAEAAPSLGCCGRDAKEAVNAGSIAERPGRVGWPGNPGGASPVASAGGGRAHEGHVGMEEPAPPGLLPAAPWRGRNSGWGACPVRAAPAALAPCPAVKGQGRGRCGGPTPGGALHARLCRDARAFFPFQCGTVREAGGFVLGYMGVRTGDEGASQVSKSLARGKDWMDTDQWERLGASRETGAGDPREPEGSTWVGPELEQP
jgi:hypothetical protein